MPPSPRLYLATSFLLISSAVAGARDLDPELRQYVIVSCSQDAYRLCPQSLNNERDAAVCMRGKRAQLNPICRTAFDKVARVLAQ